MKSILIFIELLVTVAAAVASNNNSIQAASYLPYSADVRNLYPFIAPELIELTQSEGDTTNYDLRQNYSIPLRTEVIMNLEDNGIKNELLYFYSDKLPFANNTPSVNKLRAIMVNAYYDFNNASDFIPYISIGMGAGDLNFNHRSHLIGSVSPNTTLLDLLKNSNGFVYILGIGSFYTITPHLLANIAAKYFYGANTTTITHIDSALSSKTSTDSANLAIGITYRF